METCFAAPDRAAPDELERELELVVTSKVVEGLLTSVGGLLAILNDRRQILAANDAFFRTFDIEDVGGMIGLRPGEAIGCLHADEEPAGCGTTRFCPTCGAAVAIVTSMADQRPVERICAVEVLRHGEKMDLYLEVRAVPFTHRGKEFLLLFLRDVTREQQWASEERVFFHDLKNTLSGLQGAADIVVHGRGDLVRHGGRVIGQLVRRINCEIELQKILSRHDGELYHPRFEEVSVPGLLLALQEEFGLHPAAAGRRIVVEELSEPLQVESDRCVLFRVLGNMLVNALEACCEGDEVRLGATVEMDGRLQFTVWNREPIPEEVRCRIFQKNFSTRKGMGRGLGTWSMKYFGEKFLGGEVGFVSSMDEGTRFFLTIPRRNLSRPAVAAGRERPGAEALLPSWAGPAEHCQANTG